MKALVNFVS